MFNLTVKLDISRSHLSNGISIAFWYESGIHFDISLTYAIMVAQ